MLRSADAKEDLEDMARECVQETRRLFLLARERIKCHLDELTDRHCGDKGQDGGCFGSGIITGSGCWGTRE